MLSRPRFKPQQIEDLNIMKDTEGWRLVTQVVEGSIELGNAELINWQFQLDDDGEVTKKSVLLYQDKQKEIKVLKEFLLFIKNPTIVEKEQSKEVY